MKGKGVRNWRAGLVGAVFLFAMSGLQAGLLPVPAAAQAAAQQITHCGSEYGTSAGGTLAAPAPGSLAYAVGQGGTWTFACSGTGPFTIPIASTLKVVDVAVSLLSGGQSVRLDGEDSQELFGVASGSSMTLVGLTLENGYGPAAGAIVNDGTVTVTDAKFSSNSAFDGQGGAIWNLAGSTLTVSNSTFSRNSARNSGGAIFDGLSLTGSSGAPSTLIVTNSTFTGNSASAGDGGAIWNDTGSTLRVTDSTFSGNTSGGSAGGGAIYSGGPLTVSTSAFSGNSSTGSLGGGAICSSGPLTVSDSTFSGNTSSGTSAAGGGAIYSGGPLTVSNSTFNDNSTSYVGGAIWKGAGGTPTVSNSTFSGNTAPSGGGAIFNGVSMTVSNSAFSSNGNGATTEGGAIWNGPGATLAVSNATFSSNEATDGGAISNNGSFRATNSIFNGNGTSSSGNNAAGSGGGALFNDGSSTVTNCTFTGNNAAGDGRGGAIMNGGGSLTVTNCTFSGNTTASGRSGGAIGNIGGSATVTNSTFSGNTAPSGIGGAIYNVNTLTVSNSTFSDNGTNSGNTEKTAVGGAIFNENKLAVYNSTFSSNTATAEAGNLYGGGTLYNSIVANATSGGNCSSGSGTFIGANNLEYGDTVNHCGSSFTVGNPQLGALGDNGGPTQTMALGSGSAAIGAGDPAICASAPVNGFDQRGVARGRTQSTCDIGAYQATSAAGSLAAQYVVQPSSVIATAGSLSPGQTVAMSVFTEMYPSGIKAPDVPVYLSLTGGTGSASVDGTALGPTPTLFTSDTNGYLPVQYTAGTAPAGGGTDALTVADSVYSPVALQATTSYDYPAVGVPPQITTSSNATFTVGEPGSFTVQTSGVPGGASMNISDGSATLPPGVTFTDNHNGTATLAGTAAAGSVDTYQFTITASNGVGAPATQTFTLTVQKAPTTLALVSQATPVTLERHATVTGAVYIPSGTDVSVFGQPVTLTASVSTGATGAGAPTGSVTFSDGTNTLGGPVSVTTAGSVTSATLTVPASALPAGPQLITASYSGDANFLSSEASLTQNVEYVFVGPLPPLAGNTTVEAEQTVPVTFTLLDAQGRFVPDAKASLEVDGRAAVPQGHANLGDAFRIQGDRYVYLLNVGDQHVTGSTVALGILPGDGSTRDIALTVKTPH